MHLVCNHAMTEGNGKTDTEANKNQNQVAARTNNKLCATIRALVSHATITIHKLEQCATHFTSRGEETEFKLMTNGHL